VYEQGAHTRYHIRSLILCSVYKHIAQPQGMCNDRISRCLPPSNTLSFAALWDQTHAMLQVDRLDELHEALDTDEPGNAVHYASLFSDDRDLNQGMLAETIRGQHIAERLEFLQVCWSGIMAVVVVYAQGCHSCVDLTPYTNSRAGWKGGISGKHNIIRENHPAGVAPRHPFSPFLIGEALVFLPDLKP